MKRSVVLFMIITALVFVFSGCDALQGLLSPEPVEVIVEEETGEFGISKVKGPSGRTDEETAVFTWTIKDPDRQIANYQFRKDGGDWVELGLETEYAWTAYSRGPHSFEVRAQDNEGDYSNIINWSFTYSTVEEMVLVEGGTFTMGDTWGDGFDNELPVHEVTLTNDFEIGKYEVTFAEYDAFCDATGRTKPLDNGWGRGNKPVRNLSWWDAIAYCNWLSVKKGLPVAYKLAGEANEGQLLDSNGNVTTDITKVVGYRLPTEAEWEYAARGGKYNSPYKYSGSDYVDEVAWYSGNSNGEPQEVGKKAPNDLGIHDMSGNAYEWCTDWYGSYSSSAQTNPYNDTPDSGRVNRGGAWYNDAPRLALRGVALPHRGYFRLGFRITRTVP